jgi:transposase
MLDALISGTHDPEVLAELAKGALRKKIPALQGRFTGHHALLIGQMLAQIEAAWARSPIHPLPR